MRLKYQFIVLFILFHVTTHCFAQSFTLKNEELIFSFSTLHGKKVALIKDKANNYLIYRFGTASKIEFEFPAKEKSSWKDFTYSFYNRGGGIQNEGMDLNYIYFTNKGFKYIIYDTYFAVGNKQAIGVKIIDLKLNKTTNIKGNPTSRKGTLVAFRDNHLLTIGDELFD